MAELLRGGVTTVLEIGQLGDYVLERARHVGLRVYFGFSLPLGAVAHEGRAACRMGVGRGAWPQGLARALAASRPLGRRARRASSAACLAPAQVDTCTPELLRAAKHAADERGCPITLHASQSVIEFNEMLARHGKTPVEWLGELGFLGPRTILGHAIIVGGVLVDQLPGGRPPDHG